MKYLKFKEEFKKTNTLILIGFIKYSRRGSMTLKNNIVKWLVPKFINFLTLLDLIRQRSKRIKSNWVFISLK